MAHALPSGQSFLIRTDFSDDSEWQQVSAAVQAEYSEPGGSHMQGFFTVVDDRAYDGASPDELLVLAPEPVNYLFLVDQLTLSHLDRPVLVALVEHARNEDETLRCFRALPREVASIENNLSTANLGFGDYEPHLDDEGIYRGLPAPPRQRFVGIIDLVEAAATNVTTTALARFHQALISKSSMRQHQVTEVGDIRGMHDRVLANDYSAVHELLGREEMLRATQAGGPASTLHLNIGQGYWSAVLDPATLVPRAAMLVQGPPRDEVVHTTVAVVRFWHEEGRFGVLDAAELPGGCWVVSHCIVDVYGSSNFELSAGQRVEVDYVANASAGIEYPFRGVEVRLLS